MEALKDNFVVPEIGIKRYKTTPQRIRQNALSRAKDLNFLIQVYGIFGKVIGLQKVKITHQKCTQVGKIYKFYALCITTFVVGATFYGIFYENHHTSTVSVFIAVHLQASFIMISHFAIILQNILQNSSIFLEIYESLGAVDTILHPNMEADIKIFKFWIIAIHAVHLFVEGALFIAFKFLWKNIIFGNMTCVSAYIVFGELLQFSVGINAIARRFQYLNSRLKKIIIDVGREEVDQKNAVSCELTGGILMDCWGKQQYYHIFKSTNEICKTKDEEIEELLEIYSKLADILENFNRVYGLTVRMIVCA